MLDFSKGIITLSAWLFVSLTYTSAQILCDSLNLEMSQFTTEHIDSLIDQCMNHRMDVEDKLEEYGKTIVCYSKEMGDHNRLCTGNFILGKDYYFRSDWDAALYHLYQSKNHAANSGQEWIFAHSANFLGLTYKVIGHYDFALSYQQEFLNYAIATENLSTQGSALLNLGGIYQDLGEIDKSLECQLKALALYDQDLPKDEPREELMWLNLSLAMNSDLLNDPEKAIYYFETAMSIEEELNFPRGKLWILTAAIDFYTDHDITIAKAYLKQAFELLEDYGNAHVKCVATFLSAKLDHKMGLIEQPIAALEEIQSVVIENNFKNLEFEIFDLIIKIAKENNLVDKELSQLRNQQLRFSESVSDFKTKALTVWTDNQKILIKNQEDNLKLKQAEFEKSKALQNFKGLTLAGALALLALMAYIFSARKLNRRTAELNRVLKEKNIDIATQLETIGRQKEELESANKVIEQERSKLKNDLAQKMIHIANEQEMLSNLSKMLEEIDISRDGKRKISNYLNRHNRETIWEEFDQEIASSNELFFAKLAGISAKLTHNDFRLAALIKMNLSNKEIARLLHRTVESIHMAKSRMRKKLDVQSNKMNLTAYFNFIMKENETEVPKEKS